MVQHPSAPLVSVVVVNWNGAAVLPRCLDALAAQTLRDFELLVVDNASSDGSADGLEARYPDGARDPAGTQHRLCRGQQPGRPVGPRQVAGPGEQRRLPGSPLAGGHGGCRRGAAGVHFLRLAPAAGRAIPPGWTAPATSTTSAAWCGARGTASRRTTVALEEEEVFSPCGAAAFYLRQAFLAAGGFDEDYFAYAEDVDLGFRLRLLGHRCLYVPAAVAHHVGSASHGPKSDFSTYYGHRNLVWTYVKNMPGRYFWLYLPAHLLANLLFMIHNPFTGHGRTTWLAKWHALKGLPGSCASGVTSSGAGWSRHPPSTRHWIATGSARTCRRSGCAAQRAAPAAGRG